MNLRNISLGLLFLISTSFIEHKSFIYVDSDLNCQTIIDSAKKLIQTGDFSINIKPTINDNSLSLRLDKWFQSLSFKNLTCLLNSDNVSIKFLGFTYAAALHRDSLIKNYSFLLNDTTSVQIYMAGKPGAKMKLGELLSTLLQNIKKDNDNFARRPEIEKIVSKFITQYSTYPDTYKPISFPYFSMTAETPDDLPTFNIRHEYELKNNEGKIQHVISAFVFDSKLNINVIERDSTSFISSYPPKLESWLKEFGRQLTKDDSLALRIQ
jgi:hypothetical protein